MSKRTPVRNLTDAVFEDMPAISTPPPAAPSTPAPAPTPTPPATPAEPTTPAPGPEYVATWRKRRRDYAGGETMSEAERQQRYGCSFTVRIPVELSDRFYNVVDRGGYRKGIFAEAIIAAGLDAYERGEVQIGE